VQIKKFVIKQQGINHNCNPKRKHFKTKSCQILLKRHNRHSWVTKFTFSFNHRLTNTYSNHNIMCLQENTHVHLNLIVESIYLTKFDLKKGLKKKRTNWKANIFQDWIDLAYKPKDWIEKLINLSIKSFNFWKGKNKIKLHTQM
jgi:hypothetical protein